MGWPGPGGKCTRPTGPYRAALKLAALPGDEARTAQIALLETALRHVPNDPQLEAALGEAWIQRYDEQKSSAARDTALDHYRRARDLCPLLVMPQMRLATYAPAGERPGYLRAVKLLRPADSEIWYLAGLQEWHDKQQSEALATWKQTLTLSDRWLPTILDQLAPLYGNAEQLKQALPEQPELYAQAAQYLVDRPEETPDQALREKAAQQLRGCLEDAAVRRAVQAGAAVPAGPSF